MSTGHPITPAAGKSRGVLWLLVLGVPLLLLVAWWPAPSKPRPALPHPNGYDYFKKAGAALTGMWTNASHKTLTAPELQAILSANRVSLDLLREGLRHKSHTHLDYDATYVERVMTNLSNLRQTGRLLIGEGWLAELEAKPLAALESYHDAMRLGQEGTRGGVVIERLVGVETEQFALTELRRIIVSASVSELRRSLEVLQGMDSSHDLPVVNLESEAEWARRSFPVWQRLISQFHPALRKPQRDSQDSFTNKVNGLQFTRRRAIVEAAARLFELEKGRPAKSHTDLVPAYLPAMPSDPVTGQKLTYPF